MSKTNTLFTNSCDFQGFTSYLTVQYLFAERIELYQSYLNNRKNII